MTKQSRLVSGSRPDPDFDLERELKKLFSDMSWNIRCILDDEGNQIPVPKNSTCVTAILEQAAMVKLENWATEKRIQVVPARHTREYPDATLQGGPLGDKLVAVDVKTTRRNLGNRNRVSGFTIGSYAGYFLNPERQMLGCRIPYGQFDEHWIVGFIYDWDDEADTRNMVSNIETVVAEKWRIASRSTGTGTTKHIRSVVEVDRLRSARGDFNIEEQFEEYWRNYGVEHGARVVETEEDTRDSNS